MDEKENTEIWYKAWIFSFKFVVLNPAINVSVQLQLAIFINM
jgi:hypothetical protein